MIEQLTALYELQSLDTKIAGIRKSLEGFNGAKALKQQLAVATSKAEAADAKLTEYETELKDSELKLNSIDDKRGSVEKRLYGGTVSNTRELQALEKEVKLLKEQQSELDGRTLELYDMVESAREEAKADRKAAEALEQKVNDALKEESAQRARLEGELAELASQRDSAALDVTDKSLISRYDAVRKNTGGTGIAKVVHGKCEGCRVAITEFMRRALDEPEGFQSCESCGRILMLDTQ